MAGVKYRRDSVPLLTTEPPPPRVPRPVTAHTVTHGHRLVTATPEGYRRDIRGYGNPYYVHLPTQTRWERDEAPPEGLTPESAGVDLLVDACTESGWYAWKYNGRDPADTRGGVAPLNARLTWIE